jgi:hypothetical protein
MSTLDFHREQVGSEVIQYHLDVPLQGSLPTAYQPSLSDFLGSSTAFHDAAATEANGTPASLSAALPSHNTQAFGIVSSPANTVTIAGDHSFNYHWGAAP